MGKVAPEGSRPENDQTTFERLGQWISSKVNEGSLRTLKDLGQGFRENLRNALKASEAEWVLPSTGTLVKATFIGGLALAAHEANATDYLFVKSVDGPAITNLDDGTTTLLDSSLFPTGTTYGSARSVLYDENGGNVLLAYYDVSGDTGSEGILSISDPTGGSPTSAINALGNDPEKVKQDPNTGSVALARADAADLCADPEDGGTCTTYDYSGYDVQAFATDEAGTGRGVVLLESTGYEIIDLSDGSVEFSASMTYPTDVVIDRDNGYAFIADGMGFEVVVVDINAATPSEVDSVSFAVAPADLLLYTNSYTGDTELAVAGYYYSTEIEFFDVSGYTLTSLGSETHADTINVADVMTVDDTSDATMMYVANGGAGEVFGLDLSAYTWDGSSYCAAHGATAVAYIPATGACTDADADGACEADDCDDTDPSVQVTSDYYVDADGEGYGAGAAVAICAASAPSGYSDVDTDCDDADPFAWDYNDYYVDGDGDGRGAGTAVSVCAETAPSGYSAVSTDCNDADSGVWNYADYYADNDGDGEGAGIAVSLCEAGAPVGYANADTDCDDGDSGVYSGATEVCDGDLEDCELDYADQGLPLSTYYYDYDGDGYGDNLSQIACGPDGYFTALVDSDCVDTDPYAFPGSPYEVDCWNDPSDEEDLNCDEVLPDECEYDDDGDGYEAEPYGTDCDDTNYDINPGADELCDAVDWNCDNDAQAGAVDMNTGYADNDGDGYGAGSEIETCDEVVEVAGDCNDSDPDYNPDAVERIEGEDMDCDNLVLCDLEGEEAWDEACDDAPIGEAEGDVNEILGNGETENVVIDYDEDENEEAWINYLVEQGFDVGRLVVDRNDGPIINVVNEAGILTGISGTSVEFVTNTVDGTTVITVLDEEGDHEVTVTDEEGNEITLGVGDKLTVNDETGEFESSNNPDIQDEIDEIYDTGGDDDDSSVDTDDDDNNDTADDDDDNNGTCGEGCSTGSNGEGNPYLPLAGVFALAGVAGLRRRRRVSPEVKLAEDLQAARDAMSGEVERTMALIKRPS